MQGSILRGSDAVDKRRWRATRRWKPRAVGFTNTMGMDRRFPDIRCFICVGGRCNLYPSSGYQPSDSRVAKTELPLPWNV